MCLSEREVCHEISKTVLDEVFLNLLSHTDDVSDAGLFQLPEVLLAGGSVGAEVEARDDLLHVPPHGVGPVVHRPHHEAICLNVHILASATIVSAAHLYEDQIYGDSTHKRLWSAGLMV